MAARAGVAGEMVGGAFFRARQALGDPLSRRNPLYYIRRAHYGVQRSPGGSGPGPFRADSPGARDGPSQAMAAASPFVVGV